ncbi:MAG: septation protein spoVG, partial [Aquificota bacterium]
FVSFPSKRVHGGKYFDLVIPLSRDLKEHIREEILRAYRAKVE